MVKLRSTKGEHFLQMFNIPPCDSIICIRFNGYNLSLFLIPIESEIGTPYCEQS